MPETKKKHYSADDLSYGRGLDGRMTVTITLREDETAWNPASTKNVLYGPCKVHYERHVDGGVTATREDTFPRGYKSYNMMGNIVAVIADRSNLTPEQVARQIESEIGDGDFGVAEDRIWDSIGPLCDDVMTWAGIEWA